MVDVGVDVCAFFSGNNRHALDMTLWIGDGVARAASHPAQFHCRALFVMEKLAVGSGDSACLSAGSFISLSVLSEKGNAAGHLGT